MFMTKFVGFLPPRALFNWLRGGFLLNRQTFICILLCLLPYSLLFSQESYERKQAELILNEYLFIEAKISSERPLVGQVVVLEYFLHVHPEMILTSITETESPNFTKVWVEEEDIGELHFESYTKESVSMRRALVRKYAVIANEAGLFLMPKLALDITAKIPYNPDYNSDSNYYTSNKTVKSNAIVFTSYRHSSAPSDFSGAIGEFEIKTHLGKQNFSVGETNTLKIEISGSGNLRNISKPSLAFPNGFEVLSEGEPTDSIFVKNGLIGTRTFSITFRSNSSGAFLLPEIPFTYFDLSENRFITVQTSPIEINVSSAEQTLSANNSFISSNSIRYFALILIVLAIIIVWLVFLKRRKRMQTDNKNQVNEKYIDKILQLSPDDGHYQELLYAHFREYLCIKISTTNLTISNEQIIQGFSQRSSLLSDRISKVLSTLERLNYSEYSTMVNHNLLQKEVKSIIHEIENS